MSILPMSLYPSKNQSKLLDIACFKVSLKLKNESSLLIFVINNLLNIKCSKLIFSTAPQHAYHMPGFITFYMWLQFNFNMNRSSPPFPPWFSTPTIHQITIMSLHYPTPHDWTVKCHTELHFTPGTGCCQVSRVLLGSKHNKSLFYFSPQRYDLMPSSKGHGDTVMVTIEM